MWYNNKALARGQVAKATRGDLRLKKQRTKNKYRGVEQLVARRAHNPEVAGSSPVPATKTEKQMRMHLLFCFGCNEVALMSYEACLRHIEKEIVRFASYERKLVLHIGKANASFFIENP